jgi:hypothetical protein
MLPLLTMCFVKEVDVMKEDGAKCTRNPPLLQWYDLQSYNRELQKLI